MLPGRMLNADFVNLGFSGNGKGEPEMAHTVAGIDASYFVLDFAQNNPTVESLMQVYAPFVDTIRSKHPPDTHTRGNSDLLCPGILVTGCPAGQMRELIRHVAARRIADGDRNIEIVEGTALIGPSRGDGLVDGTHPNDLGFEWMAEGLAGRIRKCSH